MPGLNTLRITDGTSGSRGSEGDQTPARMPCKARKREAGSGGRFKCVSGRQSARTRRRVDKSDNSWGHAADRSNPSRAERRRLPASVAGCSNKQPRRLLLLKEQRLPCASRRRAPCGAPACRNTWRRGRGETPGVPHAPWGPEGKEGKGSAACPGPSEEQGRLATSAREANAAGLFDN